MLESRKRDDDIEQDNIGTLHDDAEQESLSISERRARRRAKRHAEDSASTDEGDSDIEVESSVTTGKDAPTRRQRDALRQREKEQLAFDQRIPVIGRLTTYLRGVAAEIQKVTWPTREEAQRLTSIVVVVTIAFAIVLGSIDVFYGWWFQQGVESTAIFLGVAVPVLLVVGSFAWYFIIREET